MNKPKFLIEKYTDKYRSLYQAIMIDLDRDKETDGKESYCARYNINPNLTILLEKEYFDKDMELLKREKLINDEWYFEENKEQE
ncbi:MAG: hypothetical protein IJ880_17055 [Bacilli bacterium]|nr:hypothetical protein [Bacilli bacterium]